MVKVRGIKGETGRVRDTRDTRGGYRCNESLFTATAIHCHTRHTRDITTMGTLMGGTLDLEESKLVGGAAEARGTHVLYPT